MRADDQLDTGESGRGAYCFSGFGICLDFVVSDE